MKKKSAQLREVIAVDENAIKSTVKKGKTRSALQILTAYITESDVTRGQKAIHEKTRN